MHRLARRTHSKCRLFLFQLLVLTALVYMQSIYVQHNAFDKQCCSCADRSELKCFQTIVFRTDQSDLKILLTCIDEGQISSQTKKKKILNNEYTHLQIPAPYLDRLPYKRSHLFEIITCINNISKKNFTEPSVVIEVFILSYFDLSGYVVAVQQRPRKDLEPKPMN